MTQVLDIRIVSTTPLPAPDDLIASIPCGEDRASFVARARSEIAAILHGDDPRLLLIAGPCSIHDIPAGLDYARKLAALAAEVRESVLVVMRVYFEKPRTSLGWKGLIMDPHLDGTYDVPEGLRLARGFMREVIDLGLPTATETLDPVTPQYITDLLCWSAIGARTTESQTHRQMASALSVPVGFKNTTHGAVLPAINAVKAAMSPQSLLTVDRQGRACVVATEGNPDCHIILRGGDSGPNHDAASVARALDDLQKHGLPRALMIDASHANCGKKCATMPATFRDIIAQRRAGERGIVGAMLESNLVAGAQSLDDGKDALEYGKSITDQCIGWDETVALVREAARP